MSKLCECHNGYAYQKTNWGMLDVHRAIVPSLNAFASTYYEACYFEQLPDDYKAKILREYRKVLARELRRYSK